MANVESQPVEALKQHITELEAAITVCLADPGKKTVHKLRSGTRRIEAQLQLLAHIPGLPPYRDEKRAALRELKRLRRAAGAVRDLDVHEDLLEEFLRPGSRAQLATELKQQAETLRQDQEDRRRQHAETLVKVLKKREQDMAAALQDLRKALKPADDLRLSTTELLETAQLDYRRLARRLGLVHPPARGSKPGAKAAKTDPAARAGRLDDDQLHSIRKAAKAVRYMAEAADGARSAKQLAKDYEALQQSGGIWHDWLEVTTEAQDVLGRKQELTRVLKANRDRCRKAFVTALLEHSAAHELA